VGHIDFLNCLPLLWGLGRRGSLLNMALTRATPDMLSRALPAGELDISAISLMEYLKHADDLVVLPDIAVGSDGPVMSCLLISKVPVSELDGERVALGFTSCTSVKLAQLMLDEVVGVRPEYVSRPPDLGAMLEEAQAAVLIGDPALWAATYDAPVLGLEVHDLGRLWHDWTGLPFVFAVFAARREYAERQPAIVRDVHAELLAARDLALAETDTICQELARWEGYDPQVLRRYYLDALDFGFGDRQEAAVAEFARRVGGPGTGISRDVRMRVLGRA
jgi:chorismate dehydratase